MSVQDMQDIEIMMDQLGAEVKKASHILSVAPTAQKDKALVLAAEYLRRDRDHIMAENAKDMAAGEQKGLTGAMMDRLKLDEARIEAMAQGLEDIAKLKDPVGEILADWTRPNDLQIQRVRVPLGVIGIIYESRPNVTADAAALSLKSGNCAILRGGSESYHSSHAIMASLSAALKEAGLPETCIQMVPTTNRAAVGKMLQMVDVIDVIVPRGGKSLIERITADSKIPLFKHLEGLCHTYIDRDADVQKSRDVVLNAKMRRTGICGATETILVAQDCVDSHLPGVLEDLIAAGCEIRGDETVAALNDKVVMAHDEDWSCEYLDAIVSIKVVEDVHAAIEHINSYGSHHTDCILSENAQTAEVFLNKVDSAICMVNASTQFADGGQFGMGAEIGISTGKMHARGPVGVEQLTSFKYLVRGNGQCRP